MRTPGGGDADYQGIPQRLEHQDRDVHWYVALRPGVRHTLDPHSPAARVERAKSSLRAQVEHPFRNVKRHFGYDKVRYRGQHKNRQQLALLLGFHNLFARGALSGRLTPAARAPKRAQTASTGPGTLLIPPLPPILAQIRALAADRLLETRSDRSCSEVP